MTADSAQVLTDAERGWLQAWRAMSAAEQAVAERMVGGLTGAHATLGADGADNRPSLAGRRRVRSFGESSPTDETSLAAAR